MIFKVQLPNAIKFFLLLFLLFWCFTWNFPTDFDSSCDKPSTSCKKTDSKDETNSRSDNFPIKNGKSDAVQSYDSVPLKTKNLDRSISTAAIIILPFKEWRKTEMEKHETNFAKDKIFHQHRKLIRRKLNYASSKCGAKILASNPEARHRMAVLSEKSVEYFLNPCRVRTWFIIELCDAVEATQVELANYELYSSAPKEFSVFTSEVYPSFSWQHLGTFVAEDKRTMQTFDVNKKNMGKFIKVIIHSHHGKEHYCPLSVIRVLGYSMVQTLEDIENDENNSNLDFIVQPEVKFTSPSKTKPPKFNKTEYNTILTKNMYIKELCDKLFLHCSNVSNISVEHICLNKPLCRYLKQIITGSKIDCLKFYSPRYPLLFFRSFNYTSVSKPIVNTSSSIVAEPEKPKRNMNSNFDEQDIIKDYEYKKFLRMKQESNAPAQDKLKDKFEKSDDKIESCHTVDSTENDEKDPNTGNSKYVYDPITREWKNTCICDKDKSASQMFTEMKEKTKENFAPELKRNGDDIDSAGLISKDSVLFRLAAKIKTSETDLNLINKYLQQFSQSYRHQIENMKIRLNKTFEAMTKESEKVTDVNAKQEQKISVLKGKIDSLNGKINFLMKGKNELTKTVIELHGFFLILEIIIIATVFNIFMNIFNKKNSTYENRTIKSL